MQYPMQGMSRKRQEGQREETTSWDEARSLAQRRSKFFELHAEAFGDTIEVVNP